MFAGPPLVFCCARFGSLLPCFPLCLSCRILLGLLGLKSCQTVTRDSTNRPCPSSPHLVFWLCFGCSGVHARHWQRSSVARFAFFPVPTPNYFPPHPSAPMNAHHVHTWTSLTHSAMHAMLLRILACFAMWYMVSCVRVLCACSRVLGCFRLVRALNPSLYTYTYVVVPFLAFCSVVR